MARCKAPALPRSEAYTSVRRSDAGEGQRRSKIPPPFAGEWAFFSNLSLPHLTRDRIVELLRHLRLDVLGGIVLLLPHLQGQSGELGAELYA